MPPQLKEASVPAPSQSGARAPAKADELFYVSTCPLAQLSALTSTPAASDGNTFLSPDTGAGPKPTKQGCTHGALLEALAWIQHPLNPLSLGPWPVWRGWCRERFWCVKFTDYENRTLWGEKKAE